jgi:hypothetical protein
MADARKWVTGEAIDVLLGCAAICPCRCRVALKATDAQGGVVVVARSGGQHGRSSTLPVGPSWHHRLCLETSCTPALLRRMVLPPIKVAASMRGMAEVGHPDSQGCVFGTMSETLCPSG